MRGISVGWKTINWGNQVTVTILTKFFHWIFKRLWRFYGWTIRQWMIRGSDIVFNSLHCAKYFELITFKGGSVIHYNNIGKSMNGKCTIVSCNWHDLQDLMLCSICVSITGHQRYDLANAFIGLIPGWLSCNSSYILLCKFSGLILYFPIIKTNFLLIVHI